ncbi:MAG: hypothetical protein U0529_02865 [Thermoanaerobaculia bacterium]
MRQHTILPLLLLTLAAFVSAPAPAQTAPYATVATIPASPVPDEGVSLVLSGQWPDTCLPTANQAKVTRDGLAIRVNLDYTGFSGACGAAITPWSLNVPVGGLSEGTYTVEVTLTRSLLPSQTIGTGSFAVVAPTESTIFLPGFLSDSAPYALASNLTAYNNSTRDATVTRVMAWDALGERSVGAAPVAIAPGAAAIVPTQDLRPGQAVQMLAVRLPSRIALRATLERLEYVPEGLPKVPESLGRLELPVFSALFPAGTSVVAGDVSLTPTECSGAPETRRRVNLTLFNAGETSATFEVVGKAVGAGPGGDSPSQTFHVPAKSLVQFNALPVDAYPVCQPGGAWFRILGDQPFLAYISTVRPETTAGVLPYEIFPARVDR